MGKHRRHITEKELRIAAEECNLQYGIVDYLIQWVRKNQAKSNNKEYDKQFSIPVVISSVCPHCGGKDVRPFRNYKCCYECGEFFGEQTD